MQTFLPYMSFEKSAKCLDYRRLGKQRVEAKQILDILNGKTSRWENHPAVNMWRGYEDALALYVNEMIKEWIFRGYVNNMELINVDGQPEMPKWIGNEKFHASHRSNLLRKNKEFYRRYNWEEEDNLPYEWNR